MLFILVYSILLIMVDTSNKHNQNEVKILSAKLIC